HSALGLALPGQGRLWRLRLGARRASAVEEETLQAAFQVLAPADLELSSRSSLYVLDDPLPSAAVRGRALILSRGLLESSSRAAVLAHELGHVRSFDGRLTESLARLVLWGDPLGPGQPELYSRPTEFGDEGAAGCIWGIGRLAIRLAGGGCAE